MKTLSKVISKVASPEIFFLEGTPFHYGTPGSKTVELLAEDTTSRIFYPGAAASVTIAGGTYKKDGGAATAVATTATDDTYFELILATASGSYETASTVTLTCDTVDFVFTVTTEAAAAYWLDANGDQILDVDGNPIEVIS